VRFLFFDTALDHLTAGLAHVLISSRVGYGALEVNVCTRRPGTFPGIRCGIDAARAMGIAADLPAVGVRTLDAIARTAITGPTAEAPVTAAIEAGTGDLDLRQFRPDGTPVGTPLRSATETAGSL